MHQIGARIRFYREQSGYTQEKLAELSGLSPNYLSALERGVKIPRLETFIRLANILQVSTDLLLQDVLEAGAVVEASVLSTKLKNLNRKEQNKIFHVVEVMIRDAE